ncbi:MAG: hypothetical protein EA376_09490 [Phycisphaeraceae bacterium]|nr:MAG: hypothetical protein EA376_09490 [Phycisphaeraceae bacterium]
MLPDPGHTADEIARQFAERFPDGFGVMQPQGDTYGLAQHYCGSPWLGRGWIERMYGGAGPLWPEYRHNWADNELYWTARCLDALWLRPDLEQRHEHFSRDGAEAPAYWTESVAKHDRTDAELFVRRSRAGFPGHEPLGEVRRFDHDRFRREYRALAEAHLAGHHGLPWAAEPIVDRMRAALDQCARRGLMRVGIYGAGLHTTVAAAAFERAPVELVCVIDDDASRQGGTALGMPIVSREQAAGFALDAVVLSANSAEEKLVAAAAGLAGRGVEILPLYTAPRGDGAGMPDQGADAPACQDGFRTGPITCP